MQEFDVVVIGGGPAGYVAAVRAAQLGFKCAIVDKRAALGGTCLNVGCIPSKALLDSSEHYEHAQKMLKEHGILLGDIQLDLKTLLARKDKVVQEVTGGIDYLMKKNKVAKFTGTARLLNPHQVEITTPHGSQESIAGKNIILATGSVPIEIPTLPIDGQQIITSDHAINLPQVPKHLIVIGGGVIGLELGSVWRRLGAKVTVVELLPRLLGSADRQIAELTLRLLKQQGMEFLLEHRVVKADKDKNKVVVTVEQADGKQKALTADVVLVAVGRRPFTDGLGAKEIGIEFTEKGRIKVDRHTYRTNIPHIYAVGDVIDGPMLAHKAEDEGLAVAEIIAGQKGHVNYEAIPWIIYTWPEIAWVGRGEEELKAAGIAYNVGKSYFKANGRAKAMHETEGMVKILADKKTDRLLGAFIVGPRASDMIAELVLAFEFGASAEDIGRSVHAHPTLSEVIRDAAQAVGSWAINQ